MKDREKKKLREEKEETLENMEENSKAFQNEEENMEKESGDEIEVKINDDDNSSSDKDREDSEENNVSSSEGKVEELESDLVQQREKYHRLLAEFENYKRRTGREYSRLVETANENLMMDIIEVRENFDRALATGGENREFENFYEGVKLIYSRLESILDKHGLKAFGEKGEEFNPELHDAMMKTPDSEIEEDHIVQIFEKGYTLKDKVIKHARVILSSGPAEEGECSDTGDMSEEEKVDS